MRKKSFSIKKKTGLSLLIKIVHQTKGESVNYENKNNERIRTRNKWVKG